MTSTARTSTGWSDSELRRSINHLALRWQARLEGIGPDRALPWILAVLLFLGFGSLSLARYRSLQLGEEFAAWMQGLWLVGEGNEPFVTLTERDLFDGQFSLIMWPIAQLSTLLPTGPLLLILQALALSLGVVPLWRIARSVLELGVETALVLGLAYGFQPQLHNLNLSEFHPEALAVPALLWAYLFSQNKQWIRFGIAIAFVLSTRSDLGLVVVGVGALLAVEGRTRAGRVTAAAGAIWAALALGVFSSDLAGGEFLHGDAFASYGDGPVAILWGMLTNPLQVLRDFFAEENFRKLILLFAPWLFLPVLRLRFQLPLIIFGVFGFLAAIPPGEFGNPQQDVAALAFLPIAAAFALRAVGRRSVRRVFVNGRLLGGVLFASMAFFLFGAGSSLYNEPWTWGSRSSNDIDVLAAVDTIGPEESVAALERALPLLTERTQLLRFPDGLEVYKPADPTFGSDVILIDESDESWTALGRVTFDQVIEAKGYVVFNRFGTVSVYRLDIVE
ncbi:MAG: DUF2079 domain-containing protein [Acidimicrobiia bacterium]|nr:DUF2079 domain-containing protein [Acidimicrobiia bacterium]